MALFLVFGLISVSCTTQRKLLRNAADKSAQGFYADASSLYYTILLTDPKNKEAKDGLKQSAQYVIADKFAKFSKQVIDEQVEDALRTYQYAQGFAANATKVGVAIDWPHEYDEVYDEIVNEYTQKQFDIAVDLMQQKRFESAEKVFERIATFDTTFKQVSVLRLHTVLDPMYQKAEQLYQTERYKEAYFLYSKIAHLDDGYKDVVAKKNKSLAQATTLVGVLPVEVSMGDKNVLSLIAEGVADKLSEQQGAYVKIADIKTLHHELQSRGFLQLSTQTQMLEAALSLNLGYMVKLKIDSFVYTRTKPAIYTREAYEAVTERILNPYTNTFSAISKFKPATYTDKTEGQYLQVKVTCMFLHAASGKVVSDEVRLTKSDEVHVALFKGNAANLYPTLPNGNYLPHVSQEWRNMFTNPRKNLLPTAEFIQLVVDELTAQLALRVQSKLQ